MGKELEGLVKLKKLIEDSPLYKNMCADDEPEHVMETMIDTLMERYGVYRPYDMVQYLKICDFLTVQPNVLLHLDNKYILLEKKYAELLESLHFVRKCVIDNCEKGLYMRGTMHVIDLILLVKYSAFNYELCKDALPSYFGFIRVFGSDIEKCMSLCRNDFIELCAKVPICTEVSRNTYERVREYVVRYTEMPEHIMKNIHVE